MRIEEKQSRAVKATGTNIRYPSTPSLPTAPSLPYHATCLFFLFHHTPISYRPVPSREGGRVFNNVGILLDVECAQQGGREGHA